MKRKFLTGIGLSLVVFIVVLIGAVRHQLQLRSQQDQVDALLALNEENHIFLLKIESEIKRQIQQAIDLGVRAGEIREAQELRQFFESEARPFRISGLRRLKGDVTRAFVPKGEVGDFETLRELTKNARIDGKGLADREPILIAGSKPGEMALALRTRDQRDSEVFVELLMNLELPQAEKRLEKSILQIRLDSGQTIFETGGIEWPFSEGTVFVPAGFVSGARTVESKGDQYFVSSVRLFGEQLLIISAILAQGL